MISGVHLGFLDLCDSTWRAASASVAPCLLWLVCPAGPVVVLVSCIQMLSLRGCLKTGISSPLKVLQPQGCRETQTCELTSDGILWAADYGQGQQSSSKTTLLKNSMVSVPLYCMVLCACEATGKPCSASSLG